MKVEVDIPGGKWCFNCPLEGFENGYCNYKDFKLEWDNTRGWLKHPDCPNSEKK